MVPKITPKIIPDKNSLFSTVHQDFKLISPKDKARIIKVAACEPEFPPLEIIRGTKTASKTTFPMASS